MNNNYNCILKDNEKYLRGVATMEKPDDSDWDLIAVDLIPNRFDEYKTHLASFPLIPIHPEHLYFFEVGKEYEEGKDFEVKYQLCDANENSASLIEDNWQCVSKMEYDMTKYVKEYKRIIATALPSSPVVEDDTPVLFANWITDNHFTRYNNVWTSTKIHYLYRKYTTEQLYKLFKSYTITKK